MADDLRDRVLAAVRKGLAGPLDISKTKKPVLQGYSADSATENGVTAKANCNTTFPNQIKDVTPLHRLSANKDSQPRQTCAVCGATGDLWHLDTPTGPIAVHEQCAALLPKPELAEPSAAYQSVSAEPDGTRCRVEIVELPATGLRYRRTFAHLQLKPLAHIPVPRWQQCVDDGKRFLAKWGAQAQALNWSSADLFGLIEIPEHPFPSFNRLSHYDRIGLVWLLQGRPVVALTADRAAIENPDTGNITTYRKHNKPAFGPVVDSLDDLE
jgi:hypothetical protein